MMDSTANMRVQIIAKPDRGMTGTSRYVSELHNGLQAVGVSGGPATMAPSIPGIIANPLRHLGIDLRAFISSYPLRVKLNPAAIYHISTQTMATLLHFQRFPAPVIVTVLDIIPYLVRHDKELNTVRHPIDAGFYHLAMRALGKADALIAISHYTKHTLVEALGIPEERIHVVHLGVDHNRFRPLDVPRAFRERYQLQEDNRHVLYVGSDDPRKNLRTLLQAFALLREQVGNVRMLMVGRVHAAAERVRLLALVDALGITGSVDFIEDADDDNLLQFYNVANVVVLPSFYEGFGFPAIEAMACGTPAVVSNRSSLPELVDDPSARVDPGDAAALCHAIRTRLNGDARDALLKNAARFTWDRTVRETLKVYEQVLECSHG